MTTNALTHETTQIAEKTMKAVAQHRYGSPDVLALTDIPKPELGKDPILVRDPGRVAQLRSTGVGCAASRSFMRPMTGWRRPKQAVRGVDLAGVVEAVGPGVTEFKVGDKVFGTRSAAWAEYVTGRELDFAHMPAGLSFEEAAAIPTAGVTALQGFGTTVR